MVVFEARELHFETGHSSIQFDNFVEHKSRYLAVSKHSETRVREFADCAMECLDNSSCLSFNMASSKDEGELFWCELLLADMFNNSQNFKENATSHHFSKWSPCLKKPCLNGGSCVAKYDDDTHTCICGPGFAGQNCQLGCNISDGWTQFNNHCYKYFSDATSWSTAKSHCESLGAILVTIHSEEENSFVHTLISEGIWLGGNDINSEGSWVWEDGENWGRFTSWISGEPNNQYNEDCLVMVFEVGNWNDLSCSASRARVCKK
ncbi:hypothetical protein ACROYT_G011721 [Oculina patagonica]